jgi:hypothetical protein
MKRSTGTTVPSAFDTWASASSRVRSLSNPRKASKSTSPARVIGITRSRAPVCSQTICHGTMLAWCSSQEIRISSPGCRRGRA